MMPKDNESNLQFRVQVIIVCIVFAVGLLVFHRCTPLGRSLSADGLAIVGTTLVAAVIGFLAILLQVRSSSRQLREQMAGQHRAFEEEAEGRSQSVAKVLLLEIDYVYRHIFDQVHADDFNFLYRIPPNRFVVFEASAGYLGALGGDLSRAIVRFYGEATRHFLNSQQYLREIQNAKSVAATGTRGALSHLSAAMVEGGYRTVLMDSFGAVRDSARDACARLCDFSGVDRSVVYALSQHASTEPKANAQTH